MATSSQLQSLDSVDFSADGERGFVVNLKNSLPTKWKCPLCSLLMRDAIQTYRGEMACESCYFSAKGTSSVCPIDADPIEDGEFFKDRHARREILQLDALCTNRENGCDWEGVVNAFEEHRNNCEFENVLCTVCREVLVRKHEAQHLRELCPFREATCIYCGMTLNVQSVGEHESTCALKPLQCPYKCGENIQLNTVHAHIQKCPNIVEGRCCPYAVLGCDVPLTGAGGGGLVKHMVACGSTHAALAITNVQCIQQNNEQLKNDLVGEQTAHAETRKKLEQQTDKRKEMETVMAMSKQKYEEISAEKLFPDGHNVRRKSVENRWKT